MKKITNVNGVELKFNESKWTKLNKYKLIDAGLAWTKEQCLPSTGNKVLDAYYSIAFMSGIEWLMENTTYDKYGKLTLKKQ